MQKRTLIILSTLLVALLATVVLSAQEITVEPPIDVTIGVTLGVTDEATPVQPTAEATMEATTEPTAAAPAPDAEMTPEATNEVPVEPDVEMAPVSDGALLRVAYLAPDMESIDVYFDDVLVFRGLNYPSVSRFISLEPGTHNVTVTWSGGMVGDAVQSVDVSLSAGTAQTVVVLASTEGDMSPATALISEDYDDLLPGTGGFTFVNAVQGSPAVNVHRDDVVYFAQMEFPGPDSAASSSSLRVDSGEYNVMITQADDPTIVFAQRSNLALSENAYTFVALIGTPGDTRLFTVVTDESEVEIARGDLPRPGYLTDALNANENLTGFAAALGSAGLSDMFEDGSMQEYTIFAPANFVVDDNMSDLSEAALQAYIVEGKYTSQEIIEAGTLTAIDGTQLTITIDDNGIFVNGIEVIDVNIAATNGVIHMLGGSWEDSM